MKLAVVNGGDALEILVAQGCRDFSIHGSEIAGRFREKRAAASNVGEGAQSLVSLGKYGRFVGVEPGPLFLFFFAGARKAVPRATG